MGDNNNRSLPIYHIFVDLVKEITNRYCSLIIPARWYTASILQGDFTERMLKDRSFEKLVDFSDATDCFPTVEIKGGICYFLHNRNYSGTCRIEIHHKGHLFVSERFLQVEGVDAFVRFSDSISIIEKVTQYSFVSFSKIVSSQNPFGFNSKIVGNELKSDNDVVILSKYRHIGYISPNEITLRKDYLSKWKVMTPIAGEGGTLPHRVTGRPFVSKPGECCNGTYMVIGPFESEDMSLNVVRYLKTKFARFMVSTVQTTQNTKSDSYRMVPMQDFSPSSSIDWQKSIEDVLF